MCILAALLGVMGGIVLTVLVFSMAFVGDDQ